MSNRKGILKTILEFAFPVVLVIWLIAPTDIFIISLAKAFLVQGLFLLLLLVLIFYLLKWKILTLGTFLATAILLIYLIPYLWPDRTEQNDEKADLTVAQFNLSRANEKFDEVIEIVRSCDADIISFQELNSTWLGALRSRLESDYTYSLGRPDETGFYGIALFSKFPAEFQEVEMGILPNIEAVIQMPFGELSVLSSHMHTPTLSRNYHLRNAHLLEVGEWAARQETPVITVGDYNTVPWDSHLLELKEKAGLDQSRMGWQPTYPSYLPPAMIPLDYVLHSEELKCIDFDTFEIPGSDHHGVVGRYQVK